MRTTVRLALSLVLMEGLLLAGGGYWLLQCQSQVLYRQAADEIQQAQGFIEATRDYTRDVLRPQIDRLTSEFVVQAHSGTFIARSIFQRFQERFPHFQFKEACDNPFNPLDQADHLEREILTQLRADRQIQVLERWVADTSGRQWLVLAKPIVAFGACLKCHNDSDSAPPSIVEHYGRQRGFGWQAGDVVAALTVRMPESSVYAQMNGFRQNLWGWGLGLWALMSFLTWLTTQYLLGSSLAQLVRATDPLVRDESVCEEASLGDEDLGPWQKLLTRFERQQQSYQGQIAELEEKLTAAGNEITKIVSRPESMMNVFQNHLHEAIVILDVQGNVVEMNHAAERLLGMSRESCLGQNMETSVLPSQTSWNLFGNSPLPLLTQHQGELSGKRTDGTPIFVSWTKVSFKENHAWALGLLLRDLTEQKRFEEALGEYERVLESWVTKSPGYQILMKCHVDNLEFLAASPSVELVHGPAGSWAWDQEMLYLWIQKSQMAMESKTPVTFDFRLPSLRGMMSWNVELLSLPVFPSRPVRLLAILHPIERKPGESTDELALEENLLTAPPKARLLIIDDRSENQNLMVRVLKPLGYQVDLASNGRDGMEKALSAWRRQDPYQALIMDMQMPEMDGWTAARRLREVGYAGKIIGLSALHLPIDCQRGLDAGCNFYLAKPIDWDLFFHALGEAGAGGIKMAPTAAEPLPDVQLLQGESPESPGALRAS